MNGDDEYEETVEAIKRGAPLPERRPNPIPIGLVVAVSAFVGLLWQALWDALPDYQLFVNVAGATALIYFARFANRDR